MKSNSTQLSTVDMSLPGPKDKCPCGSGRKFRKCCRLSGSLEHEEEIECRYARLRQTEYFLVSRLLDSADELFEKKNVLEVAWKDKATKNIFSAEVNSKKRADEVRPLIDKTFANQLVFHKSTKSRFVFPGRQEAVRSERRTASSSEPLENP